MTNKRVRVYALDAEYYDQDRIHTISCFHPKHKFIVSTGRDHIPCNRGIEEGLFLKLISEVDFGNDTIVFLTWGGPERNALTYRINQFALLDNIKVIDFAKVIRSVIKDSILKNVSKDMGVARCKYKASLRDAEIIYAIYRDFVEMRERFKYIFDTENLIDLDIEEYLNCYSIIMTESQKSKVLDNLIEAQTAFLNRNYVEYLKGIRDGYRVSDRDLKFPSVLSLDKVRGTLTETSAAPKLYQVKFMGGIRHEMYRNPEELFQTHIKDCRPRIAYTEMLYKTIKDEWHVTRNATVRGALHAR